MNNNHKQANRTISKRILPVPVLMCVLILLTGCEQPDDAAGKKTQRPPTAVIVAQPRQQIFTQTVEALGTAHAIESTVITTSIAEKITRIGFEDGQQVSKGHVIVQLNDTTERAELKAANSRLQERRKFTERSRDLRRQKIISQAELETAEAELANAQAVVAALQVEIADHAIRAPFAGRLGLRNVSVGALIQPSDAITTLDDLSVIRVDFTVPALHLAILQPRLALEARTATWPDRIFRGELASVGTQADPHSRAVTARALLPDTDGLLRPGMLVTLQLLADERQALAIPEAALMPLAEKQFVFILTDDHKVRRSEVTIGTRSDGRVEILDGLNADERVVVHGTLKVSDGAAVEVMAEMDGSRSIADILREQGKGGN